MDCILVSTTPECFLIFNKLQDQNRWLWRLTAITKPFLSSALRYCHSTWSKLVPIAKKIHGVGLVFVFHGSIDFSLSAARGSDCHLWNCQYRYSTETAFVSSFFGFWFYGMQDRVSHRSEYARSTLHLQVPLLFRPLMTMIIAFVIVSLKQLIHDQYYVLKKVLGWTACLQKIWQTSVLVCENLAGVEITRFLVCFLSLADLKSFTPSRVPSQKCATLQVLLALLYYLGQSDLSLFEEEHLKCINIIFLCALK